MMLTVRMLINQLTVYLSSTVKLKNHKNSLVVCLYYVVDVFTAVMVYTRNNQQNDVSIKVYLIS